MSELRVGPFNAAALADAHRRLQRRLPGSRAFWAYDLDAIRARAEVLTRGLQPLEARVAYALKANGLPDIVRVMREAGLHADAGSLGELELALACGYGAERLTLSGNGRTPEEAAWAAAHGIASVSADHPEELDLLEREAARAGRTLHVALRVNPGIRAGGHRGIETGHSASKFGMSPRQALAVFAARERWPHLDVAGLHVHVGSQIVTPEPVLEAARSALALAETCDGAVTHLNLGGGFGVDYDGDGTGLDPARLATAVAALPGASAVRWCFEPGRWLVAGAGVLVAEVLWDKRRDDPEGEHRFVVLAAGMNDLLRPALYGARHRVLPLAPRDGAWSSADVVGPVCETSDRFAHGVSLPAFERGDLVALLDAGAYGSVMSSRYNGRNGLPELVQVKGEWWLARTTACAPSAPLVPREQLPLS